MRFRTTRRQACLLVMACGLAACASYPPRQALEAEVDIAVRDMGRDRASQLRSFAEIERLGKEAVPYLVGHLADERPLPAREMTLANGSNAFERTRHYAPQTVHDALSALLNQLTGVSFLPVYNGATPERRRANHSAWAAWCVMNHPAQADACRGSRKSTEAHSD